MTKKQQKNIEKNPSGQHVVRNIDTLSNNNKERVDLLNYVFVNSFCPSSMIWYFNSNENISGRSSLKFLPKP